MDRKVGLLAFLLTACALLGCGTSAKALRENTASTIDYALPTTEVAVVVNLVITRCDAPVGVKGTVTLTPSAVASPYAAHRLRLDGTQLASFWKKHDLSVDLHPNGAIKSVNGATSDRTGAILMNVLKIATAVGSFGLEARAAGCNEDTHRAFVRMGT